MNNQPIQGQRWKVLAGMLLSLSVLAVSAWSSAVLVTQSQQGHQHEPDAALINNKTQALRIASVTDRGTTGTKHTFSISVVNVSDKPIAEYTFFKKDGSAVTTSGATTGWALAPGNTDVVKVDLEAGDSLTLAALLFTDGTGQGDMQEITRMRDYRAGVEEQYQRVVPILDQAKSASPRAKVNDISAALRQQLSSLPVPPVSGNISPGKAAGLHDAKQFVEMQVIPPQGKQDEEAASLDMLSLRVNRALGHVEKALFRFHSDSKTN